MAKRGRKPKYVTAEQKAGRIETKRKYDRERWRSRISSAQDIGSIPRVKSPSRRKKAIGSFRLFCETYLSMIFFLPWSRDGLRVIEKIEKVVLRHQTFVIAMPRGSGKSQLCKAAALWAILTGQHKFVMVIGAVAAQSEETIQWFKKQLSENELLKDDFPEVCYPIRCLENESRRCHGQRYKGKKTNITWKPHRLIMPTIPGSKASGAVIGTASLDGHIRGVSVSMPDGTVVRPTLALCDDPQTEESARSQGPRGQTTIRLKIINETVRGLAGPMKKTAILVPCTVICRGDLSDRLLDHQEYPAFRGERTKRFYSWPANKALWEEYREIYERAQREDIDESECNKFYKPRMATCGLSMEDKRPCETCQRRNECMDCGAVVDWAARLDDEANLSAIQAAMHEFYDYKAEGFAAEFQNEPLTSEGTDKILTASMCAERFNGRPWAEVPVDCTDITMAIDVQQSSLWYVVIAWKRNFTGYILDYGVWPHQKRINYTLADIVDSSSNLQVVYPNRGIEGAIFAGLEDLVRSSIDRDFKRSGGAGLARINRIFVDAGKWPQTIAAVKYKVGGSTMMLCKGVGIKAGNRPMSTYKRKPGERHGEHWYTPSTKGTKEFPHVAIDTNYWKSFIHSGFLTPQGEPGALTIFGEDAGLHGLFASHITAETYVTTQGHGRDVQEWSIRPQRPDNHWFDAAVYAACAASMIGCAIPNRKEPSKTGGPRRRRVPVEQMLQRRREMQSD